MSYQPGKMGMADAMSLVCFATLARVFLTGLPRLAEEAAGLEWLVIFVASLFTAVMAYLLLFVRAQIHGDLIEMTERLIGRPGAWAVGLYYIFMFHSNVVVLLRQYAENTLLTAIPNIDFQQALLWYAVPAAIILYLGIEVIARGIWLLTPIIFLSFILTWIMAAPFYQYLNLAPWMGTGLAKVAKTSVLGAGFDVGIIVIFILAPAFQNTRTMKIGIVFGLGLSTAIKCITALCYIMAFGDIVGAEKILPFFELSRLVYLGRYIQHIESIFILTWVIGGIIFVAISMYMGLFLIGRLLGMPTFRPLIPVFTVILTQLAMIPPSIDDVIKLDALWIQLGNIGIYIIPVILLLVTFIRKKRRSASCESG